MKTRKLLAFIFEAVIAGLAFAFVLQLLFRPETFDIPKTVTFIQHETPERIDAGQITGIASYAFAVERAAPAVVNIYTKKVITQRNNTLFDDPLFRRFFGNRGLPAPKQRIENSLGSGVIVNESGYLLTNNHVIEGATEIAVVLADGRITAAAIVGTDPESDLAVLKIKADDLPAIAFGNSDNLRVGDVVLAIGNPFGVGQTVTSGIVSAKGRSDLGLSTFENFIQTDAAINPGNSGGALINTQGDLIGINTAIFSRSGGSQGIGFAIPSSLVKEIMAQIIEQGRAMRGWLGVEMQDVNAALAESFGLQTETGAIVAGVHPGGPAYQAGIRVADIILSAAGRPVYNSKTLMNIVASHPPGSTLALHILRNGEIYNIEATMGERPTPQRLR